MRAKGGTSQKTKSKLRITRTNSHSFKHNVSDSIAEIYLTFVRQ